MTEDIILNLPDALKNSISTLRVASRDKTNAVCMVESDIKVINFDKIPNFYSKGRGWSSVPKSNDALYISDDKWYFIEFKNGSIDKADVYRKLYDSIIMLIDMGIIDDFDYSRNNINYILVYNSDKYPKIQKSESREKGYSYISRLAMQEQRLFEIEKFEGYLFKETHTYSKELFEKNFVSLIE